MAVKITGARKIIKNFKKAEKLIRKAAMKGTIESVLILRNDSQSLTPVDTGALRSNVSSEFIETKKIIVGILSYFMQYAIVVHERLNVRHTVGKAKFLEIAVINMSSKLITILAKNINRALK